MSTNLKRLLIGYPIFGAGIAATMVYNQSDDPRSDVAFLIGACCLGAWIIAAICVRSRSPSR